MARDLARVRAVLLDGAGDGRRLAIRLVTITATSAVLLPAIGVLLALAPTP